MRRARLLCVDVDGRGTLVGSPAELNSNDSDASDDNDDAAGTPPPFPQIYGDGLTDEVLARSTDTVATGEWVHLRLTVLPQGIRSVLAVYRNDLEANGLLKPVWEPVAGIEENFTDNSGLVSGGYVGYGLQYGAASVMGAVDHVVVGRTL